MGGGGCRLGIQGSRKWVERDTGEPWGALDVHSMHGGHRCWPAVGCEPHGPSPEARVTSLSSSLGDQEGASGTPKRSSHTGGIGWIH